MRPASTRSWVREAWAAISPGSGAATSSRGIAVSTTPVAAGAAAGCGCSRVSSVWRVWSSAVSSSSTISVPDGLWLRARSSRDSRSCRLWPRVIAPTIRALPFRVWSRRATLAAWAGSTGVSRQLRRVVSSWSSSSLPSSRKMGSRSVSSSSRSCGAGAAGSAGRAATGGVASGRRLMTSARWEARMSFRWATSSGVSSGSSRALSWTSMLSSEVAASLSTFACSAAGARSWSARRCWASSRALARWWGAAKRAVPEIPDRVCAARIATRGGVRLGLTDRRASSCRRVAMCWRASTR